MNLCSNARPGRGEYYNIFQRRFAFHSIVCRSAGDTKHQKSYLPEDKQFLVTSHAASSRRVSALKSAVRVGTVGSSDIEVEGWVAPELDFAAGTAAAEAESYATLVTSAPGGLASHVREEEYTSRRSDRACSPVGSALATADAAVGASTEQTPPAAAHAAVLQDDSDSDEEYVDMSEFADSNLVKAEAADAAGTTAAEAEAAATGTAVHLLSTRMYTVSVCYDNYYQTPRIYFTGFSEEGGPLTPEQMQEDVMQDYVHKTVTMESHPHLASSVPHISVHPCRHAATMQRLLGGLLQEAAAAGVVDAEAKLTERVGMYMFLFLKFVSSVVPTIEYDSTADYDLSFAAPSAMM